MWSCSINIISIKEWPFNSIQEWALYVVISNGVLFVESQPLMSIPKMTENQALLILCKFFIQKIIDKMLHIFEEINCTFDI